MPHGRNVRVGFPVRLLAVRGKDGKALANTGAAGTFQYRKAVVHHYSPFAIVGMVVQ